MSFLTKIKSLLSGNVRAHSSGRQQIEIIHRSDGLTSAGTSPFIAPWVSSFTRTLKCSDGTDLPIRTTPSLITGTSEYKKEILTRQIASAIRDGYTPIVLSANGQQSDVFDVLRTIYHESAINYISETINSGCYDPFGNLPQGFIIEFFYQMVTMLQQQPTNGMLIRNYISICVRVFFFNPNSVGRLIAGELNHMRLMQEIQLLYQNNRITEQERIQLEGTANSAQSVSVLVFSVIQDYLYKLRGVSVSKPTIQLHSVQTPRIKILNSHGQNLRQLQPIVTTNVARYDLSVIIERKSIFLQIDNETPRDLNNIPIEQCFQWYISKTLQMETNAKSEIRNGRILLILDNLNSIMLNWFWWLIELPNCILLLNYDDFYSQVADSQDRRQQLISKMERIYFFSVIDEHSASWASRTFGTHTVPKVIVTYQPYRQWIDLLIKPKAYAHDEVEKPWFSTHEIQHLGNDGIVYSKNDKIFKPCYRENGKIYEDKSYKGRYVNFCTFSFY